MYTFSTDDYEDEGNIINNFKCVDCTKTNIKENKGIEADLIKLGITESDLIREANNAFFRLNLKTKRGKKRQLVVAFCLREAYKVLNKTPHPIAIAQISKIKPSDITKSFSLCSEIETGYRPLDGYYSPIDFIKEFFYLTGLLEDSLEDALLLAEEILNKDDELYEKKPQTVAAGILYYYCVINGVEFDLSNLAKEVGKSETTIKTMYKKISEIDNS